MDVDTRSGNGKQAAKDNGVRLIEGPLEGAQAAT